MENLTIFLLNKLSFFKGVIGAVSPISKEGKFSIMPWTQSMSIYLTKNLIKYELWNVPNFEYNIKNEPILPSIVVAFLMPPKSLVDIAVGSNLHFDQS